MIPVFVTFIPFAVLFVYLIPTSRSRILAIFYMAFILFFIWGVGGFVFSGKSSTNELYVFYAFYIFMLAIHVPLLIKLFHLNHKKELAKSARAIFGTDVTHLTDNELHYRLKHD